MSLSMLVCGNMLKVQQLITPLNHGFIPSRRTDTIFLIMVSLQLIPTEPAQMTPVLFSSYRKLEKCSYKAVAVAVLVATCLRWRLIRAPNYGFTPSSIFFFPFEK
jgi:hypothetical protein